MYTNSELMDLIQDAAYEVRLSLAPGYIETVYRKALAYELGLRGLQAEQECPISVYYKGENVGNYFADIIVEGRIIIELKAVRELDKAHEIQLVNYLTATGLDNGLLINFGGDRFRVMRKNRIYKHSD